jgi:polysaccharide biosynthesis transport protein
MPVKSKCRWGLACGVGFAVSVLVGVIVWLSIDPLYTSQAIFRISIERPTVLGAPDHYGQVEFEILKNTHKELLLSSWVLEPVVSPKDPDVKPLPIFQEKKDPVKWLSNQLSVSFPGEAEVMVVSLGLPEPADAAKIISAVVDSYSREVLYKERADRQERIKKLEAAYSTINNEVRTIRVKLRNLAEKFGGASDPEALAIQQRLLLEQLASSRSQLMQTEMQESQLGVDLVQQKELYRAEQANIPTEQDCLEYGKNDLRIHRLIEELAEQDLEAIKEGESRKKKTSGGEDDKAQKSVTVREQILDQYEKKVETLRGEIHKNNLKKVEQEIKKLEASIEQLNKRNSRLAKENERLQSQVEQLGSTSIEVEMYRDDLKNLKQTMQSVAGEREMVRAELEAPTRITLLEKPDPEHLPETPSNYLFRLLATFLSMAISFLLCMTVVILWNIIQKRRSSICRDTGTNE